MTRYAIRSWRAQLLVDACKSLPGGEAFGSDKQITEPYIDLANQFGYPIPKNFGATRAGIRDELHRNSPDSSIFVNNGWCHKRPILFRKISKGIWGLTEAVRDQELRFSQIIDNESFLTAGDVAVQPTTVYERIPVVDNNLDKQEFYGIEMLPIPGFIEFPNGQRILKLGISEDPLERLANMQTSNPCPLRIAFRLGARSIPALEAKALLTADPRRAMGEWIVFDAETRNSIGQVMMNHI
jgi:hypothetical protein